MILLSTAIWMVAISQTLARYDSVVSPIAGGRYSIEIKAPNGRTIWRRTALFNASEWSPDHKLFMYADCSPSPWRDGFNLFTWRPGHHIVKVHVPPLPENFGEGIFPNGLRVSPDCRHALLLVADTQGEFDLGYGTLLCVDVNTGFYNTVGSSTRQFRWTDSADVAFEEPDNKGGSATRIWTLPGTHLSAMDGASRR